MLKARNIFEYDLVGYFNNISHRCVARQLDSFCVPKHIIILLVELSCGEVKGITPAEFVEIESSAELSGFDEAWEKHEYLHKYRPRWRPRGVPQGGCLSPILSVLPLIFLEELGKDIKYISYCDDGILYGDSETDMESVLRKVFEINETTVEIHSGKSRWIKKDGEWLSALKFVGLRYDPKTDVLSACTRKGSVLPMQIDAVGLLSKEASTYENILGSVATGDTFMAGPDFEGLPAPPRESSIDSLLNAMPLICEKAGVLTPLQETFK